MFVSDWSFRSPGEMAEAAVLAWVRGPGTGCKALPWASARCSVRDVVYRHCQEQVRIAVGEGDSPGRAGVLCVCPLNFFETENSPISNASDQYWGLPLVFYDDCCFASTS